ncbi:hypothetical protein, partial [Bacteroides sp. UBA939]|uniref:hypothetical protein n=1 Tax=Bacteroides sp. UBA939 TaxID=1946092 RepID=UPI0025BC74C6
MKYILFQYDETLCFFVKYILFQCDETLCFGKRNTLFQHGMKLFVSLSGAGNVAVADVWQIRYLPHICNGYLQRSNLFIIRWIRAKRWQ